MTNHRFMVYTKSNPQGDDVGAENVMLCDSGVLAFTENDNVIVAYSPFEWTSYEYGYEET